MTQPHQFAVGEESFLLDGEPFRILSGALHYFRVHPGHWADRIGKAREMGLNTIETYVAWNAHAPSPAEFRLDGGLDLGRFLDLVAAEGMFAIVRPGPYICAEWTNGGLPTWLGAAGVREVRGSDPAFLAEVRKYLDRLAPVIVPRQADRGGPVILVQVENEYGAYGRDHAYLRELADATRDSGVTVPLVTVDQPDPAMLANGSLEGILATGSFGSHIPSRTQTLRNFRPTGPLMCMEFWDGWFDDWGGHHHVTSADETAGHLDELLRTGASVNIYMFHGGTNFGLTNGANDKGTYVPITTSYDYDAPLDESGHPTPKYWAFRDVIAKYTPSPGGPDSGADAPSARSDRGSRANAPELTVPLAWRVSLWDVLELLGRPTANALVPGDMPLTADELGGNAFTLYAADIAVAGDDTAVLTVGEVRDRAQVFLNRQPVGVLARDHHETSLPLPAGARGRLEILVEDLGRVDYGPRIGEPKGLIGPVSLGGETTGGWTGRGIVMEEIAGVAAHLRDQPETAAGELAGPAFARAVFDLRAPADLFVATGGWGKGIAWLNGFCLGRYWSRGPQRTLYVPGPVTRARGNELIIMELQAARAVAAFVPRADLGHTER